MTEKEKLQKGLIYNPNYDEELQNEIKNAQDLCFEYNNTQPSDINKKMEILQKLNIKMGKRCTINNSICYVQKLNLLKVLTFDMFLI